MKKLITFVFAVLNVYLANAQETNNRIFKKFKVEISPGYAIPQESGSGGNALFAIEPKYAIMDQLSVGLRMEAVVMFDFSFFGGGGATKANASYLATGDYYFSNNKFRPFLGAGAGMYTYASIDTQFGGSIPVASKFGFMARSGFEYGHLRVGAEYNFVAEKSGYLGLKLGVVIGGGRK